MNSYTQDVKGKNVTFKHLGVVDIPFEHVTSVSAAPFTENGELVVVNLRHRGLDLPGGHVEPGEKTPEETLNREVMEEACMTIRSPILADVIETDYFDDHPSYILLYGTYVDELQEFTPNRESSERVTISPSAFINQYEAGNKTLMKLAIARAWELVEQSK